MQLSEAVPGQRVTIVAVSQGAAGLRLEAVGFVAGTAVQVGRRAPMGDPTLYMVRGTQFALRRETAALVEIHVAVGEPAMATPVDAGAPLVGSRDA